MQQLWRGRVGDVAAQSGLDGRKSFNISAQMMDGRSESERPHPTDAQQWMRPHQQTEGIFDFLKHVGVFGLGGRLGSQRQQALCGWGAGEVVGTTGQH